MRFFGHSGAHPDKSDWQSLADHLLAVAQLAQERAAKLGIPRAGFLAGILHDLGKYTPEFQRRLEGASIRVDHSTAGAALIVSRASRGDRTMAELIAYAIFGHHAGLPDKNDGPGSFVERRASFEDRLDPAWEAELAGHLAEFQLEPPPKTRSEDAGFSLAVLGRLLFACLVDADFTDTERHYARLTGRSVDRSWPDLPEVVTELIARFDTHMNAMPRDGAVNALRRNVLESVRAKAAEPRGLFTLTVPTGGGKTLASLGFALDHAKAHGLRRIIYAIPYTSIIDQTVEIFRSVLGDDMVLAHHSAIEEEAPGAQGARSLRDKRRLAMEDWAAPVIVTTNVQLFESLFAARPSRARKILSIVDSVVILDEVQTLPRRLLRPSLRMIEELETTFRSSVILCTATQPAFDRRVLKGGLALAGRELAPDPKDLARRLRRVTQKDGGALDDEALAGALQAEPQALVIVNSRRHALDLFRLVQARGLEGAIHLTTRQCAAHRRLILADIRSRLKSQAPCRVIATSLVEAGVDLDFPKVWRAKAGLDQIVQAAGRCNREGRRDPAASVVTIFEPPDHPPPREIAALVEDMSRMRAQADLLSQEAIENYFEEVYWRMGDRLDARDICADFSVSIISGTNFAYRSVAEKYRMIESGLEPVIVPFDEVARKAIADLGVEAIPSGALARALQPYLVLVPPQARRRLIEAGHVAFAQTTLRADQFAVLRAESLYVKDVGLLWEDADYLSSDDWMIS